jgi:hypothetical protein
MKKPTADDETSTKRPDIASPGYSYNIVAHLRASFMKEEQVLESNQFFVTSLNLSKSPRLELRGKKAIHTFTIAAPRASVAPPANAPTIVAAKRLSKDFAIAAQMQHTKSKKHAVRKTGRLPK